MLRALRKLLGFVLILAAGAAIGYALLQWWTAQQSESASLESDEEGASGGSGIVDQVQSRIRLAVEEGKRAAAEARAELESEAFEPVAAAAEPSEAEEAII